LTDAQFAKAAPHPPTAIGQKFSRRKDLRPTATRYGRLAIKVLRVICVICIAATVG
jgi:hypothetical protein